MSDDQMSDDLTCVDLIFQTKYLENVFWSIVSQQNISCPNRHDKIPVNQISVDKIPVANLIVDKMSVN
jgi:hypothetical protein